jgi:hypothetical protein
MMTDIPKIVPVNLGAALKAASAAHVDVKAVIAEHARAAAERRQAEHDKLVAENKLTEGMWP